MRAKPHALRFCASLLALSFAACPGADRSPGDIGPHDDADAEHTDVPLDGDDATVAARDGLHVKMALGRAGSLFDAPVPALDLAGTSATPGGPTRAVLADWPAVADDAYLSLLLGPALEQGGLASQAGAIFLPLGGLDDAARSALAALPSVVVRDLNEARALGIVVWVEDGADAPRPWPFEWTFMADGGPFGAPDLLAIKPLPGIPFPANATVQIAVTRALAEHAGTGAGRDAGLTALLNVGPTPWQDAFVAAGADAVAPGSAAHDAAYRAFIDSLPANSTVAIRGEDLIGLALIPIGDASTRFLNAAALALARDHVSIGAFDVIERYDDFCVAEAEAVIADYQHGELPFNDAGDGRWVLDADGAPLIARQAKSRVFVTIPRVPPETPLPVAVFIRTGGGGDRPLIDRGLRGEAHGQPIIPRGDGPAKFLARAGWVGLSWDGPHGGLRNVSGGDEQFLVFNMVNPVAAIANIQQTALEVVSVRRALTDAVAATPLPACDDASRTTALRDDRHALIGHSMGAWIAPLAMAIDPSIDAVLMSGAGGAWIENVLYKLSPIATRPLAELILGYDGIGRALTPFDPALTLLQWAGEAADPQVFGQRAMTPTRDVLVIQGIVDTYIMPPIAQALQVALGLDLAQPALDRDEPRLAAFAPLSDALALVGRGEVPLPVSANRESRTAVVVQLPEDGVEDGHEVFFQRSDAHRLWGCWLHDVGEGRRPNVRGDADILSADCPID